MVSTRRSTLAGFSSSQERQNARPDHTSDEQAAPAGEVHLASGVGSPQAQRSALAAANAAAAVNPLSFVADSGSEEELECAPASDDDVCDDFCSPQRREKSPS